ncbi:MAG: cysteine--tRNA ligase [Thermodesulfobacteriota bacterium]|nr:cysteine--tRNA ligase [Thermodesulfobacteriota bacterium]
MTSILDAIGNTPLFEIKRLNPNPKVTLLAKLEYFNPGGSVKDRIAKTMIMEAEASGALTPEKIVLEATSGNTGIGLALVCAVKGYRLLLTMSESASVERRKILQALGADIRLTPPHLGTDGAIEEAYRLAREDPDTYFMTDQFNNNTNWRAHYDGTGREIWEQTGGRITMLVATMGTTGTLMGTSRRLKEYNPNVQVVGVEPYLGHKIQGLKNMKESYRPGIFENSRLDRKVNIDDERAFEMTRRLAKQEGMFVGMSSGAAMAIACEEVKSLSDGVVVVILPDGGERYLSTPLFAMREQVSMKFFNTLTRTKEPFEPLSPGKVSIYSCGPTLHDRIHVGECRRFVVADLLCRYLTYKGYGVTHVVNITDLDDKTILGSEKAGMELTPFTDEYFEAFLEDAGAIGMTPAAKYARASEHVEDMVALVARLLEKGFAYEKLRSVYFDISRFTQYGKLSGIDLDKIRLGSTVNLDEYEKANPRDFTLLKRSKLSELKRGIYTKTPWGAVRPSWHIESAAMAMKHLGETFDIYATSRDLTFPHNENEIAVTTALTGKPLARYWIHSELVLSGGKKAQAGPDMPYVRDLLNRGYSGRAIRYWLLSHNYRKPLDFSFEALDQARSAIRRLDECLYRLNRVEDGRPYSDLDQLLYDMRTGFTDALDDDLDIPPAIAIIFQVVRKLNALVSSKEIDLQGARRIKAALQRIDEVLGVFQFEESSLDAHVQGLMAQREEARGRKDWGRADEIREQLWALGVEVRDEKTTI